MMTRVLTLLMVAQLALVAWLYWPAVDALPARAALIFDIDRSGVERIQISDVDGQSISLNRSGDDWSLESGLPASRAKVSTLLSALLDTDPGYPIAQSKTAAQRFEVSDEVFERRIEVSTDSATAVAYLGSSPAFRKIHARREAVNEVFVIELNNYDAATESNDWLDRSLLSQRGLTRMTLYGVEFSIADGRWSRSDGGAVDGDIAETLVQALASLQVTGIAKAEDEDLAEAGEALRITVNSGDAAVRLSVLDNSDSERYYLRSDTYTQTFDTSAYDAERIIEAAESLMRGE